LTLRACSRQIESIDSIALVDGMKVSTPPVPLAAHPVAGVELVGLRCDRPGQGRRE